MLIGLTCLTNVPIGLTCLTSVSIGLQPLTSVPIGLQQLTNVPIGLTYWRFSLAIQQLSPHIFYESQELPARVRAFHLAT